MKIQKYIKNLCLSYNLDSSLVLNNLDESILNNNIQITDYLNLAYKCSMLCVNDSLWGIVGGNILIDYLNSGIPSEFSLDNVIGVPVNFSDTVNLYNQILDKKYIEFIKSHSAEIDNLILNDNDYLYDYSAVLYYINRYALKFRPYKSNPSLEHITIICETPQYVLMRYSVFVGMPSMNEIKNIYLSLSNREFTPATPSLMNSALLNRNQMASCMIASVGDSMEQISRMWHIQSILSKYNAGWGKYNGFLRHGLIGHRGSSKGVIPWLKIDEAIAEAVDQESCRKGSISETLPIWHSDIFAFLDSKDISLKDSDLKSKIPSLFTCVWIPDIFYERLLDNKIFSLFSPEKTPLLNSTWGLEFSKNYEIYESKKLYIKQIPAIEIWNKLLNVISVANMPYICNDDAINYKSNQNNIGKINTTNLCSEIMEVTIPEKYIASCNLSSIVLSSCVKFRKPDGKGYNEMDGYFDFKMLGKITRQCIRNLDKTIDITLYIDNFFEIKDCNLDNRPLGLGVQDLDGVFKMLDLSWTDKKSRIISYNIFETIYYNALCESVSLAKIYGPYKNYEGSPLSKGQLQFDLWDNHRRIKLSKKGFSSEDIENIILKEKSNLPKSFTITSEMWTSLKDSIKQYGVRNSLLISLMPTSTTSIISTGIKYINNNIIYYGGAESFEPRQTLFYRKIVIDNSLSIIDPHVLLDLKAINAFNKENIEEILKSYTLYNIKVDKKYEERHKYLCEKYLPAHHINYKILITLHAERSRFICQSSSFNCYQDEPNPSKLSDFLIYAWDKGLKTSMYYLRVLPQIKVNDFNITKDNQCKLLPGCENCG